MDCGRFKNDAEWSTAASVAGDERTAAVGNSGRTGDFILCSLSQFGQQVEIGLLGRDPIQIGMRPARVVPSKIVGNIGARGSHTVVSLEVERPQVTCISNAGGIASKLSCST